MLAPRGGVHPPLATPIHDAIKTMRVWQSRQCSWHAGNTLAQFGSLSAGTTTPSTLKTVKTLRADSVTECSSAAPQCSRYLIASNCRAHRSRVSDKCACVVCGPRGKACVCSHSLSLCLLFSTLLFSRYHITTWSAAARRRPSAMPLRRGQGTSLETARFHEPGIHHGSYTPGRNYRTICFALLCFNSASVHRLSYE